MGRNGPPVRRLRPRRRGRRRDGRRRDWPARPGPGEWMGAPRRGSAARAVRRDAGVAHGWREVFRCPRSFSFRVTRRRLAGESEYPAADRSQAARAFSGSPRAWWDVSQQLVARRRERPVRRLAEQGQRLVRGAARPGRLREAQAGDLAERGDLGNGPRPTGGGPSRRRSGPPGSRTSRGAGTRRRRIRGRCGRRGGRPPARGPRRGHPRRPPRSWPGRGRTPPPPGPARSPARRSTRRSPASPITTPPIRARPCSDHQLFSDSSRSSSVR